MIWSESLSQSASKEILCSIISLEGECYNQSNTVYENGSCRETYEPFTDDDPQNGVAEALAELEYKNELLSLSILGSNVMLNVVMQNDKINKMPKTYKGIPMSGSELEKRMDIATFDVTKKYKEGTMVKFKSLDGEYILGEAGKSAPCAGGVSAFKAYDKSSYKGHNSVIDGLENMGRESKATLTSTFYALGGGISKFSTFTRDASLEFGEKVLGLNYDQCAVDSKSNKKLREMYAEDDKRDAEDYDKLREKAPNKDVFDNVSKVTSGGLILTDIVLAGHGLINIAKSGISLAKLSGKAQNVLKFGDKIANKSKNTVNKIEELNKLKNTKGAGNPSLEEAEVINRILPNGESVIDVTALPGSKGIDVPRRLTPDEMRLLTEENGVEFALVYQRGERISGSGGQYKLFSGTSNRVQVPIDKDSMLIYHTHPAGSGFASDGDRNVLTRLMESGSPQRSSQIIPIGSDEITRFDMEGTPSNWPR
ncbi:hypothetical protein EXM65_02680 [Clostridium botulinum]|uniref:Uncharacterized protein n=1 Tax=Clostridium botulinum TaxID=1491 RepID=A0A6M0SJU3_CLOBO|nr:hypothetical protein [Clostridium botulinum]